MKYLNYYMSPLGEILLAADDWGLTGLWFTENQRNRGRGLSGDAKKCDSVFFKDTKRWLDLYFSGKDPGYTPDLHLTGSDFHIRVCEIMLEIPYGKTTTYKAIAQRIASERGLPQMAPQAVGGAVGRNPISLIVPCHRVVGTNGNLTGYGGGLWRKEALLKLESRSSSLQGMTYY